MIELIKILKLDETMAEHVHEYSREKFNELVAVVRPDPPAEWDAQSGRYTT